MGKLATEIITVFMYQAVSILTWESMGIGLLSDPPSSGHSILLWGLNPSNVVVTVEAHKLCVSKLRTIGGNKLLSDTDH